MPSSLEVVFENSLSDGVKESHQPCHLLCCPNLLAKHLRKHLMAVSFLFLGIILGFKFDVSEQAYTENL